MDDHPFLLELWVSLKRFVRWVIRPAFFVIILLFVYDYGGDDLVAEDRFVIIVLGLFAFIVVLLDMLPKDGTHKTILVVATATVGAFLALAILIADHIKVDDQVNASAENTKSLAEVERIEAIASTLGDAMFLRVNADGSIEVMDSTELKRDHEIKLLNARVAGFGQVERALSRHLSRDAMPQILSKINVNELLGVSHISEQEAPLEGAGDNGYPSQDAVEKRTINNHVDNEIVE